MLSVRSCGTECVKLSRVPSMQFSRRFSATPMRSRYASFLHHYLEFADAFDCAFDAVQLHLEHRARLSRSKPIGVPRDQLRSTLRKGGRQTEATHGYRRAAESGWPDQRIHLSLCYLPDRWLLDSDAIDELFGKHVQVRVTGHLHKRELSYTDIGIYLQARVLSAARSRRDLWRGL